MKKRQVDRFRVLFLITAFLFTVVIGRLFFVQVIQGDFWERESWKTRTSGRTIPFERGWIMARDLTPLASSENTFELRFVFGYFRKESSVGQIGMIYQLLTGQRLEHEKIYRDPAFFVDRILDLTFESATRCDSTQKMEDIIFYLERLFGLPDGERLEVLALRSEDSPFKSWRDLDGVRGRILSAVDLERTAISGLEQELHLDSGTLMRLPGKVAEAADRRVASRIRNEGEGEASYRLMRRYHSQFDYYEEPVCRKIPYPAVMKVVVQEELYPGYYVMESNQRRYPSGRNEICPSIIGKMGKPGPRDLEEWEEHRRTLADISVKEEKTGQDLEEIDSLQIWLREIDVLPGEEMGRLGLEAYLEPVLRGKRGYLFMERDRYSRRRKILDYKPPIRGRDVVLTIDAGLQRAAERVLGQSGHNGAIALINPWDGAVLALASHPSPSRLELTREYGRLLAEADHPLLHRAVTGWNLPPPGSVFKLVTAVAALEEGRSQTGVLFDCQGRFGVGRETLRCDGIHPSIGLEDAIVKSCNIYFYKLSRQLDFATMFTWAEKFGFGHETGILDPALYGLPATSGREGSAAYQRSLRAAGLGDSAGPLKLTERGEANLMRFCIGQGAIDDVTPLQVARMVSGLATGALPRPYLIQRIGRREIRPPRPRDLGLDAHTLEFIRGAMRQVVSRGTARRDSALRRDLEPFDVAGKTGTAQIGGSLPTHAWFAGYLPSRKPALAFAVFVESCGLHGGETAAPLLNRLLEQPEAKAFFEETRQ